MEVSQFTYFQQVGGFDCEVVSAEITYGLERLAMYVQGVDRVYDLSYNGRTDARRVTYGDVFLQAEQEYSRYNFEYADTKLLHQHFIDAEAECKALLATATRTHKHEMALPAYDQCIKASHLFNLLGCARRHLGDRAPELHPARARTGQGLLRGVAQDRGRARLMHPDTTGGLIIGIPALIIAYVVLVAPAARGVLVRRGADPRRCRLSRRDRRRRRHRPLLLGRLA